jgi:hypothetical protein
MLTAFMSDRCIAEWTKTYSIVVDYHNRLDVFRPWIVSRWRERYPTLAGDVSDDDLGLVGRLFRSG